MEMKSWAIVWILLLELVIVIFIVPSDWVRSNVEREHNMISNQIGTEMQSHVQEEAYGWYMATMVETGAMAAIKDYFFPTRSEQDASLEISTGNVDYFGYVGERIQAFGYWIIQMFSRISMLASWLPFIGLMLLPAVYDGINTRRIKKTNFDYTSPIVHRMAFKLSGVIILLLVTLFIAPFAVWPMLTPISLMIIVILLGLAIGNTQKRF